MSNVFLGLPGGLKPRDLVLLSLPIDEVGVGSGEERSQCPVRTAASPLGTPSIREAQVESQCVLVVFLAAIKHHDQYNA